MSENKGTTAYIGLTIGPIIKTLLTAKRTRHLWGASYSFAYIMKEIAKAFDQKHPDRSWYKPALGEAARLVFGKPEDRTDSILYTSGVGIFPDHLIVDSPSKSDVKDLNDIAETVIDNFANQLVAHLKVKNAVQVQQFIKAYFQIHIIRDHLAESENPILGMSERLSIVELHPSFPIEKESYLFELFDQVGSSFLAQDAFGNNKSFLSIPEIALSTHLLNISRNNRDGKNCNQYVNSKQIEALKEARLNEKTKEEADEQYVEWVKAFISGYNKENEADKITFLTGQKYIAIVQADGDSIGKLLSSLPSEKLEPFSLQLTSFALEAASLVEAYDGMPVYFGGDDALFFAPVVHGDLNIFNLLRELSALFELHFKSFESKSKPTLSFGLSITYLKYPLYEALEQSGDLLREVAKEGLASDEDDEETGQKKRVKNNIAFQVLRHSGSAFSGLLHLDETAAWSILDTFTDLFNHHINHPSESLRSITYMIPSNKELLNIIARDRAALAHFLENSFDEDIHKSSAKYLSKVADLIHKVYTHSHRYPVEAAPESFSSPDRMTYNLLKTIAFLTTPEN